MYKMYMGHLSEMTHRENLSKLPGIHYQKLYAFYQGLAARQQWTVLNYPFVAMKVAIM